MFQPDRIDGWKAIGAHFGRDRTTVMRWAQTRGLPVRRMPGGKTATVYALKSELDQWARSHGDVLGEAFEAPPVDAGPESQTAATSVVAPTRTGRWRLSLVLAGAGLLVIAGTTAALLLTREFGALPDAAAFAQARTAAETGLRLDPELAEAHRALGFIRYWWDNDPVGAGQAFRQALALAPNASQTHFWYGNILAANGQDEQAERELTRARLLEPGSVAIQTDQAWADWSAGRDAEGIRALERIIRTHPEFAVAYECLAIIRLGQGDPAAYVSLWARYAELRGDPALLEQARDQEAALRKGATALHAYLLEQALAQVEVTAGRNHAWAAFVASTTGDREVLLGILDRATAREERWGSAGMTLALRRKWATDADIITRLNRLRQQAVE